MLAALEQPHRPGAGSAGRADARCSATPPRSSTTAATPWSRTLSAQLRHLGGRCSTTFGASPPYSKARGRLARSRRPAARHRRRRTHADRPAAPGPVARTGPPPPIGSAWPRSSRVAQRTAAPSDDSSPSSATAAGCWTARPPPSGLSPSTLQRPGVPDRVPAVSAGTAANRASPTRCCCTKTANGFATSAASDGPGYASRLTVHRPRGRRRGTAAALRRRSPARMCRVMVWWAPTPQHRQRPAAPAAVRPRPPAQLQPDAKPAIPADAALASSVRRSGPRPPPD